MTATEVKQTKAALENKLHQLLRAEFDNFEKETGGFKISRMDVHMIKDGRIVGDKPEILLDYVELSIFM